MKTPDGRILPSIKIGWDAERQSAVIDFDQEAFKSLDMVKAVLEIAADLMKFNINLQRMAALQQQASAQQQAAQIRNGLRL